ncbi:MAG TPA: BlaI/MecI/CopY family transcriptional regulator, partial [Pyrinomonadaceae bacterium]|nr:BlaI/MecI/CopY family transcriptional regulator [Pyrinomonadaceae bacterium]
AKTKPTQYTTILKLMQIMHQKGLVTRNEKEKAHIYRAAQSQQSTRTNVVGDLLDKMFQGSAAKLVQHVLETKAASREELAEIRRMITEAEGETK